MPSSELIHLWKDPFVEMSDVLLERAEERLAEGSGRLTNHSARGRRRQRLVGVEGEGAGQKVSPPRVSEKVQGKRAATDEMACKKRKTAGVAPHKPGGISLGGDQTTRTWSAAMSKWSDDDGALVAPPPSTEVPPHSTCMEVQSEGGEGVPEQ